MPNILFGIIAIVIALNIIFLLMYVNKPQATTVPAVNKTVTVLAKNVSNQNPNISLVYINNCINSTKQYVKTLENITNITLIEARFFNKSIDAKNYVQRNWSSIVYEVKGSEKDISNRTVVSVFDIRTNRERNFTLPILCNENGKIGNYSSCLLDNIPNIPSSCFNFTINLTECEIEWKDHFILDDIWYSVEPPGGAMVISSLGTNKTKLWFNFTVNSSRKMLESFGMNIIERTFAPLNDDLIFSSIKNATGGKGGSVKYAVNLTNKKGVEFYATVWFKKKCYDKYMIY
jgi:hypothetical protein